MPKKLLIPIIGLLLAAVGGWGFFQKFQIKGLKDLAIETREPTETSGSGGQMMNLPPVQRTGETIRVASFNIQVFGTSKSSKPHVMERLAIIVREFDIVAIQEIRSTDNGIIPRFVDLINSAGRRYDYVVGPRLGRSNSKEQYAFIFDTQSVEIDRRELYTVDDPAIFLCVLLAASVLSPLTRSPSR